MTFRCWNVSVVPSEGIASQSHGAAAPPRGTRSGCLGPRGICRRLALAGPRPVTLPLWWPHIGGITADRRGHSSWQPLGSGQGRDEGGHRGRAQDPIKTRRCRRAGLGAVSVPGNQQEARRVASRSVPSLRLDCRQTRRWTHSPRTPGSLAPSGATSRWAPTGPGSLQAGVTVQADTRARPQPPGPGSTHVTPGPCPRGGARRGCPVVLRALTATLSRAPSSPPKESPSPPAWPSPPGA